MNGKLVPSFAAIRVIRGSSWLRIVISPVVLVVPSWFNAF
ncbi:hypothetical protein PLANPX_4699 [Lacipirellula parvula]|uniref:Uncharacterized protein n=1 Tax=Lacipirellula parvula TaxID=2650471 RepID=A0A5K7XGA1_9BACT|nr:hypothetical protein PLANPX_4699 [Lacipirellula parvula]